MDDLPCFVSDWGNCDAFPPAERNACSQRAFGSAILTELFVPNEVKSGQKHGRVIVRAVVPKNGSMLRVEKVVQGLSPACDAAAVQALARVKGRWLPAKKEGKAVGCVLYIPIDF